MSFLDDVIKQFNLPKNTSEVALYVTNDNLITIQTVSFVRDEGNISLFKKYVVVGNNQLCLWNEDKVKL